jgi:hypothetical protein
MAIIPGTSTATLTGPANRWTKAPTHVSVHNPLTGKWMGVLPSADGFRLYEDLETSTTGTLLNGSDSVRPTLAPLPDGTGFTVVWAAMAGNTTWNTYLFSDPDVSVASGTFSFSTIISHDTCPMTAVYDTDGALWVGRANGSGLVHVTRRDAGGTVLGPVQWGTFGSGQSGLIVMGQVGSSMWAFSSGNDEGGRSSKTIPISAPDIAQANWTSESGIIPALPAGTGSDDHLGGAVDVDGTAYVVGKTSNNGQNLLLIYVVRRSPGGVFDMFEVEVGPDGGDDPIPAYTRPNIVLANGRAYVLYGSINDPRSLWMRSASLDDMVFGPREEVISGPDFSDSAVLPFSPVTTTSGVPILANERDADVIHLEWIDVASPAIPSYQGADPVTQAYLGTSDATKAYLGQTLVRQGG